MKSVIQMGLCVAVLSGGAALAQDESWSQPQPYGGSGQAEPEMTYKPAEEKGADTGPYVLIGGGTEGYTGRLASQLNPGFAYGAEVGVRPTKLLGFELGYSGGLTDIDVAGPGGTANGADIVRNGGQAAVTVGLTTTRLQPYLMGGIGIQFYDVRGNSEAFGYKNDTSGYVPTGAGLRYNIGRVFTADARVNYNFAFSQQFAPITNTAGSGRYQALLQFGGTY